MVIYSTQLIKMEHAYNNLRTKQKLFIEIKDSLICLSKSQKVLQHIFFVKWLFLQVCELNETNKRIW